MVIPGLYRRSFSSVAVCAMMQDNHALLLLCGKEVASEDHIRGKVTPATTGTVGIDSLITSPENSEREKRR
jgi:hypothetical protein